jgi:hypothetical protein
MLCHGHAAENLPVRRMIALCQDMLKTYVCFPTWLLLEEQMNAPNNYAQLLVMYTAASVPPMPLKAVRNNLPRPANIVSDMTAWPSMLPAATTARRRMQRHAQPAGDLASCIG